MIAGRLKQLIFKKLTTDLSKVEIIFHDNSLWFIDREKQYWYLEFQKGGKLYWRWQFFFNFFTLFSMERDEFEPLISEWLESILNCEVTTTYQDIHQRLNLLESILNCEVTTTVDGGFSRYSVLESILNCKVTTTQSSFSYTNFSLESILNCGTTSTHFSIFHHNTFVKSVLNGEIKTITISNHLRDTKCMEEILNIETTI